MQYQQSHPIDRWLSLVLILMASVLLAVVLRFILPDVVDFRQVGSGPIAAFQGARYQPAAPSQDDSQASEKASPGRDAGNRPASSPPAPRPPIPPVPAVPPVPPAGSQPAAHNNAPNPPASASPHQPANQNQQSIDALDAISLDALLPEWSKRLSAMREQVAQAWRDRQQAWDQERQNWHAQRDQWFADRDRIRQATSQLAMLTRAMLQGELHVSLNPQGDIRLACVYVPPGDFPMGRTEKEKIQAALNTNTTLQDATVPRHRVAVTRGYFIGKFEITNQQYAAFLNQQPAGRRATTPPALMTPGGVDPDLAQRPVTHVSWREAKAFCDWLTQTSGLHVRLPTEVEWEYAARGRGGARYARHDGQPLDYLGQRPEPITPVDGAPAQPRPVGGFPQDQSWCGVFDLSDNVSEWCHNLFDDQAYQKAVNHQGPGGQVDYQPLPDPPRQGGADLVADRRSYRGGSTDEHETFCEAATRRWAVESDRKPALGFRIVIVIPDGDVQPNVQGR